MIFLKFYCNFFCKVHINEAAFNIFIIGPWYKLIKQLQYFNWRTVIFIKFRFIFILFKTNQIQVRFPLNIVNI